jgi:hypothetical protein
LRVETPLTKGLGDHRDQGLLAAAPRLQEARKVAAASQPRDRQLEAADACVEAALAVAVTVACAALRTLVACGAGDLSDLAFHELDEHQADRLAQHVGVLACQ